jgi:hypothetical protein
VTTETDKLLSELNEWIMYKSNPSAASDLIKRAAACIYGQQNHMEIFGIALKKLMENADEIHGCPECHDIASKALEQIND